jgi:hypothetical protein
MLVGLMLTRNGAWVLGASLRAALRWCDAVVVLDHASTDATKDVVSKVLAEHEDRVLYLREDDPVWDEMNHRQRTLEAARERFGARVVANVDDDEILTANVESLVRRAALALVPGEALEVPWVSVWNGMTAFRDDDSPWSSCQVHLAFADAPGMTYRPAADGYQHHNRRPRGNDGPVQRPITTQASGGLLHLQFASRRRLLAKQALYKMIEVLRWPGRVPVAEIDAMYSRTALDVPQKEAWIPEKWWGSPIPDLRRYVDLAAVPWQELEAQRLVREHGRERFAGLNLFGVV